MPRCEHSDQQRWRASTIRGRCVSSLLAFALLFTIVACSIWAHQSQWIAIDAEDVSINPEGPGMPREVSGYYRHTVAGLTPLGFKPVLSYSMAKSVPNAIGFLGIIWSSKLRQMKDQIDEPEGYTGEPARHVDPDWLGIAPLEIDGAEVPVNLYFLNHIDKVLGNWSRKDTLYGGSGFKVTSNGDLSVKLREAVSRLPRFESNQATTDQKEETAPAFIPPAPRAAYRRRQLLHR